ncbi:MAG: hypothetical protein KBG28_20315 [Kofleriaceae bacterium]|nr:hypothetical protein [Kofleriaceae bacterium]
MVKWLGAAAVLVLVAAFLLWRELRAGPAALDESPGPARTTSEGPSPTRVAPVRTAPAQDAGMAMAEVTDAPVILHGELLHLRVEEEYPRTFLEYVADCYKGGLHRKEKLKVGFNVTIKDHEVRLTDIKPIESTLTDKAVERCFLAELAKIKFRDDTVPDYVYDDELVIRLSLLKRFSQEPEPD